MREALRLAGAPVDSGCGLVVRVYTSVVLTSQEVGDVVAVLV